VIYLALLYGVYVPDWDFIPNATDPSATTLHVSIAKEWKFVSS
jgi:hypothetical protein